MTPQQLSRRRFLASLLLLAALYGLACLAIPVVQRLGPAHVWGAALSANGFQGGARSRTTVYPDPVAAEVVVRIDGHGVIKDQWGSCPARELDRLVPWVEQELFRAGAGGWQSVVLAEWVRVPASERSGIRLLSLFWPQGSPPAPIAEQLEAAGMVRLLEFLVLCGLACVASFPVWNGSSLRYFAVHAAVAVALLAAFAEIEYGALARDLDPHGEVRSPLYLLARPLLREGRLAFVGATVLAASVAASLAPALGWGWRRLPPRSFQARAGEALVLAAPLAALGFGLGRVLVAEHDLREAILEVGQHMVVSPNAGLAFAVSGLSWLAVFAIRSSQLREEPPEPIEIVVGDRAEDPVLRELRERSQVRATLRRVREQKRLAGVGYGKGGESETESESESAAESEAESETAAESESESESAAETETAAESESESESAAETETETETAAESESETAAESETRAGRAGVMAEAWAVGIAGEPGDSGESEAERLLR
ncbi:MAG: hypothetical protein AB7N76_22530 [Planctomycetota bacterium]